MEFRNMPIRRKLMTALLLTSSSVLLVTCVTFFTYEIITLRKGMVDGYVTCAEIIAENSTASLAFQNESDATQVLGALKTYPGVVAACLYDKQGRVFATYPAYAPKSSFPSRLGESGYRQGHLDIFHPVTEGDRTLGAVYIQSDLSALTERYRAYAWLVAVIIVVSIFLAYLLSRVLQTQISMPILALAQTAKIISSHRDFSVRGKKFGEDELGLLTDAFNQMLSEILAQDQALKISENNYRKAVEAIDDYAIMVLDRQGLVMTWNVGVEKIMGYTVAEIIGKNFSVFYTSEDLRSSKPQQLLDKAVEQGRVEEEGWRLRQDGTRFLADVTITPLRDEKREIRGFVQITKDITERKKVEEEIRQTNAFLNAILENIPNMIFVKDATELRFMRFNKAGEELLGLQREELMGKNDYDFFPKEQAEFFVSKDQSVLVNGRLLDIPEESIETKTNGNRILHTKKIPIMDEKGKPQYLLGISEDITEQKERENLKIYTKALENSNKEMQDFVFVASHDLQEPLRKIQAFGEFLRDEFGKVLDETGRDYLERMRSAAQRMQVLINDLLSLTRVTTKAQPFVSIDLSEVLKDVLSDLEVRIQEKGAKVELGPLPAVEADATQMRQLFQNLISNALKFQKPDTASLVRISAETVQNGQRSFDRKCVIKVEDNGIGFDNKYSEQIFKVFERLHGREAYEGTGIGLAICRKVVERHGGTIKAQSVPGKGSTFIVTLPFQQRR